MFAILVTIRTAPGERDTFLPLVQKNAAASVADEPGCHRFDVLIDPAEPDTVLLYEVYDAADDLDAHRNTPHYKAFDAAAGPLVVERSIRRLTLTNH
ncbi:MAG: putative quinol monooxygenase [Pseudomonadota bacterium]